jgi:hypothetical protein
MKSILVLWLSAWFSNMTVSQYVDDLEPMLRANRDAYLSGPHTLQRRDGAVVYFDQQWTWLKSSQACGSHLLIGRAGQSCIQDRSRAGQWPWEVYYRDAILAAPLDR